MPLFRKLSHFIKLPALAKTGFRQQLVMVYAVGIILLTLLTTLAISTLTQKTLRERLLEDGLRITKVFAEQSVLALLYRSPDNARDIVKTILGFPDIAGAAIYDQNREVLLSSGVMPVTVEGSMTWPEQLQMNYESSSEWFYIAPVYSHAEDAEELDSPFLTAETQTELLGYVRVAMSKETLHNMMSGILFRNILVSCTFSLLLLLVLYFITSRMTKPLKNLADIMRRADQGEYYIRAEVGGPKDIIDMEHAFNTMIQALEAREEELTRTRDAAIESARAKGEFAANVTHELRTPLNGVLGMLELLQGMELNHKQQEYIGIAKNSAEALLRLIDDILDFSKNDAGKARFDRKDFYLENLLNEIVGLLSAQTQHKKLSLSVELAADIPPALNGVPERLRQVLINLVGNAIKFTERGGIKLRIGRSTMPLPAKSDDEFVLLFEVIDTGIGIAESFQKSIFEAFLQVDGSSSRKYTGSGLGLAICRQLVEYMGGQIGVDSVQGRGSCFWFTLPFYEAFDTLQEDLLISIDEAASQQSAQDQILIAETQEVEAVVVQSANSSHVLVVDDNITNQQVAVGMLERLGCKVTVASTGQEALDIVFREPYTLILMDIQMPGMDGYEVTDYIRSLEMQGNRIPIIAMTANTQKSDIEHCLEVGMDDFLPKPLKINMLQEKLTRWLTAESPPDKSEILANTQSNEVVDSSSAIIDLEVLRELQRSVGEAFNKMIDVYLEDLPRNIEQLQKAFKEKDIKMIELTAHTLKGSSRSFGAMGFAQLCKKLEERAKRHDHGLQASDIDAVVNASEHVCAELGNLENLGKDKVSLQKEKPACILVVDDQRDMRIAIHSVLEQDGYSVEEASTGSQAISICERKMPDLILMDAMMPGTDGFTACQQLQLLPGSENVPILIVTALDDAGSIERAFSVGATDYIPKPVNFKVLRKRISRLLDASMAEKHVRHLAYHDPLTGLPNRATFMEQLAKYVSYPRSDGKMLAVMFIDLDRFKLVNDTLGHEVGDLLLKAVSERLTGSVRESDMVSRLGGDEFTIILNGITSPEVVARIAEKICKRMSEPFVFMDQKMYVTTSIGISIYPIDGLEANDLIKHADTAMFRAKEKRNGYHFYELGMETLVAKRMQLENALRRAIDQDEFVLYYQPQVDLDSNQIVAMEALLRWQPPGKDMIPPSDFIPLAEETGLIIELGAWVLRHACEQLREWIDKGYPALKLSINLSGMQLEDNKLVQEIEKTLADTFIDPSLLELEITESAIMKNPNEAGAILESLRRKGMSVAIDDFGTGHSSLNYLRKLPVDTLKIDRSFVSDISTSSDDAAIISGIIALAKSLRLKVIAEGVETQAQLDILRESRCDYVQGFFLYKPMPVDVFESKVFGEKPAINRATNF